MTCYQCEEETNYLFPDSRCRLCTRLTPAEIKGEVGIEEPELADEQDLDFS